MSRLLPVMAETKRRLLWSFIKAFKAWGNMTYLLISKFSNDIPHNTAVCYKLILEDHFIHIVIEAPHLKLTVL